MSLINKMLNDLEKRGVKPGRSSTESEAPTTDDAANAAYDASATQAEQTTAVTAKKQPSRIVVYGLLFLLLYVIAYVWLTQTQDKVVNQLANPLQAMQYQPKSVSPLNKPEKIAPDDTEATLVAAEIKNAIAAEIQQADATNAQAIDEILTEAEQVRQAAIHQALEAQTSQAVAQAAMPNHPQAAPKPLTQQGQITMPDPQNLAVAGKAPVVKLAKKTPNKTVKAAPKSIEKPAPKQVVVAKTKTPPLSPNKPKAVIVKKEAPKKVVAKVATSKPKHATTVAKHKPKTVVSKASKKIAPQQVAKAKPVVTSPPSAPKIVKTVRTEHKAEALYQKALKYVQQGRVSEAQTVLANALDINPAHQDARQTLAALLLDNQRIQAAKDVLQDGLVVAPNHVPFRMTVARLEVELGNPNLALDTLLQGKKQALNHAEYQAFLGTLLQGQNRHEEAITHFQNALNINRGMSNVLIGMGVSYQALNRLSDAKVAYQKAQYNSRLPNDLKDFLDYRLKEVEQKISSK